VAKRPGTKNGTRRSSTPASKLNQSATQLQLPFGPIVNKEFLSNHWLDHRLPLEPEWDELTEQSKEAASKLAELWAREAKRVELYGDEAGLEEKFIQPVFEILGWNLKYQTFLQGREPDYALFATEEKLDAAIVAGRTNPDFWLHADVVADAKAWHVSLDRPVKESGRREYPPEQIEWYLDRSRCDFGILTNGRYWRLVPRDIDRSKPRFDTFLEVDLPALIARITQPRAQLPFLVHGPELDLFLQFYLLFSVHGFAAKGGRTPLIKRAVEGSSEYALGVSEELKERVFEALRLSIEGFLNFGPNGLLAERDMAECREQSLVFLYRLLFVLYAEDRGFLPYQKNEIYTRNRSLARFRNEIASKIDLMDRGLDKAGYSTTATNLWSELKALWDIVDTGHRRYDVPPYNGGLFSNAEHPFLDRCALPDSYTARIIDQLSRSIDRERPEVGFFRVDYRDLAIQQLGSVYEGLLELHPKYAINEMRVVQSKGTGEKFERVIDTSIETPKGFEPTDITYRPGQVYLTTDKGERRLYGSYYTPDQIVSHMIGETLGPVCKRIQTEIESELASAQGAEKAQDAVATVDNRLAFSERVLRLKVLDPAMGSGHFLIRACQYLAEEIATNPYSLEPREFDQRTDEASLLFWKRRVAEACLYGVDVNPMAVELAKLALWLETVATDAPLAFLDHHLQCGDSIIGARIAHLDTPPGGALVSGIFAREIASAIPQLLEPISAIRDLPSTSLENVKEKERLYRRRYRVAKERFQTVADAWCAAALEVDRDLATGTHYAALVQRSLVRRGGSDHEQGATHVQAALRSADVQPFHWELAFPEVFLDGSRRGFDVIIGNPPYDVLAEKEAGARVAILKKFVENDPTLEPSTRGKNNLYKLFICRALELLASDSYLSFIVPMPLLGDEQASGIREALLANGSFRRIDAFPQKDNVAKRVFRDAKLSTVVFVFHKHKTDTVSEEVFSAYRHPENVIDLQSPSLRMRVREIKLYDPANLTIVSCDQKDWDLAVRLGSHPGFKRLGTLCKSFQGEVNETTDKKYLYAEAAPGRRLVLRGANITMYSVRDASQGTPLYLDIQAFQAGKAKSTKAFHSRGPRIGFQRSAPQNNFRRVIAAYIPEGEFCFDTVSYVPFGSQTLVDLQLVLAVLNSTLIDWYFSIGSTNSKVNEYQFNILPFPSFTQHADANLAHQLKELLAREDHRQLVELVATSIDKGPFDLAIGELMISLAQDIRQSEDARGHVAKTERAHLGDRGNSLQTLLDSILFKLARFGDSEVSELRARLDAMA